MCSIPDPQIDWWDRTTKIATIIIACCNLFFAVFLWLKKNERDDRDKERDRKLALLKTLILDHHLGDFYDFFKNLNNDVAALKTVNPADGFKSTVHEKLQTHFITLREQFIDLVLAVDQTLYESLLNFSDELQDKLADAIFDEGIVISNDIKFNELIAEPISETRTEMIKKLFEYRG